LDHQTFDITLNTLTYGGDAMGRLPDARAVFVPFGLPGEQVRVRLTEEKRGFARGEIVEILRPAQQRIAPRCKHYGKCGGCHYQHLAYETQLEAKTAILSDQLTRIGKIQDPPVMPGVASPEAWNYRNHIQFHLDGQGRPGFHEPNSNRVIPVTECHLPESSINALWPQLEMEPGSGMERVSLRAGADDDLMLVLESDSPDEPELEIEAGISVVHLFDEHAVIIAGGDHITNRILGREFNISAPSFFQVNSAMAEKMIRHLLDKLPLSRSTLLDVYCGVGLFSAFLAPKCDRLIGIESSASACGDFAINLDEFENVELYEDFAENVLPTLKLNPDIILVDPPRAGIDREALDAMVRMAPGTIAYVSCDPSTLARDLARLINNGYKLLDVTPFDLFPQTYHIESISILAK